MSIAEISKAFYCLKDSCLAGFPVYVCAIDNSVACDTYKAI